MFSEYNSETEEARGNKLWSV